MGQVEGFDKPLLIVDNMAVRPYLRSDNNLLAAMIGCLRSLSEKVGGEGKTAPILMGSSLNYFDTGKLRQMPETSVQVIGTTDTGMLYANSINENDKWADIHVRHKKRFLELDPAVEKSA